MDTSCKCLCSDKDWLKSLSLHIVVGAGQTAGATANWSALAVHGLWLFVCPLVAAGSHLECAHSSGVGPAGCRCQLEGLVASKPLSESQ